MSVTRRNLGQTFRTSKRLLLHCFLVHHMDIIYKVINNIKIRIRRIADYELSNENQALKMYLLYSLKAQKDCYFCVVIWFLLLFFQIHFKKNSVTRLDLVRSTDLGAPGYRDMDQQCSTETGGHIRGLHSGRKITGHPACLSCSRRGWGGWLIPTRGISSDHCVLVWGWTFSPAGHPQTSAARNDFWKTGRRLVRPSSGGTHTQVKSA